MYCACKLNVKKLASLGVFCMQSITELWVVADDYTGSNDQELTVQKGQQVEILDSSPAGDSDWCEVRVVDSSSAGAEGACPHGQC